MNVAETPTPNKRGENELMARVFDNAAKYAQTKHHEFVLVEHILFALTSEQTFIDFADKCAGPGKAAELQEDLKRHLDADALVDLDPNYEAPRPTRKVREVMRRALVQEVFSNNYQSVTVEGLILSILNEKQSHPAFYLQKIGLTRDVVMDHMRSKDGRRAGSTGAQQSGKPLDDFCDNLNDIAEALDPLVGREDVIDDIVHALQRRKKNNVLAIGEPGVGKTAIIEGLAKKIVSGDVPDELMDVVIYSLDMGRLIAGTRLRGEFEERLTGVLDELATMPNAVLYIDEFHTMIGAGGAKDSAMDASNLIKPALANGSLRCIGTTTFTEFYDHIEKDTALMRRFWRVDIDEPSRDETVEILTNAKKLYENFHDTAISEEIVIRAVDMADTYMHDRHRPDKAFDVIDLASTHAKLTGRLDVDDSDLVYALSKLTALDEESIKTTDTAKFSTMVPKLKKVVFGQDHAIEEIADAVIAHKAGLGDSTKPIYSALAVGPTGVGKTFLCKEIAKFLNIPLIRFDMSEYMEKHSVAKLIGAPPGYTGHGEGRYAAGKLITEVNENPYCVLLLDEVEKAHGDVFNLLLQVLDEASLTGSNGKKADFSNCIVIMTSNLGAKDASKQRIGFQGGKKTEAVNTAVKDFFPPELLNRLDNKCLVFGALGETEIGNIVKREIAALNKDLGSKQIQVIMSPESQRWLRDNGYSPEYGARPLTRLIKTKIKTPLSKLVMFGSLVDGGRIKLVIKNDDLIIDVVQSNFEDAQKVPAKA